MRLAAGAATAGIAYHAGKNRAQQDQVNDEATQAYDATQQQPQAPQQYAPAPPAASAPQSSELGDLNRLVELHSSGSLTDEEFAAAKANLLGGSPSA
jgi:hypothetical protein